MDNVLVRTRFIFFDGSKRYTVEFFKGLQKWFVFNNTEESNAVYFKEDKRTQQNDANGSMAEDILNEYLNNTNHG